MNSLTRFISLAILALMGASALAASGPMESMTRLPDSVLQIDANGHFLSRSGRISALAGQVLSQTAVDPKADVKFHVALKMRNLDELRSRIANGEILSQAEMAAKYYPLPENWQSVADWLTAQGLQVVPENPKAPLHLGIIAHGPSATVSAALGVEFAAVQGADGKTYTSAVSAPNIPSRFADKVIGVTGLQPHIRPQVQQVSLPTTPDGSDQDQQGLDYFQTLGPLALLNYYHGLSTAHGGTLPFDGTGQIIAIAMTIDDIALLQSDLTQFWIDAHSSHTVADLTIINPGWYTPYTQYPNEQPGFYSQPDAEATIDLEWSSAMAEGAKIRLYESFGPSDYVPQIIADKATIPGLNQVSSSAGIPEDLDTPTAETSDSQYYASLAAAGITMFAASGDGGSNPLNTGPNEGTGPGYPTSPLSVYYPACDPSVVAVGGTQTFCPTAKTKDPLLPEYAISLDTTNIEWQTDWPSSGGGYSQVFERPSWQDGLGTTITANANGNSGQAMRTVPDVAAMAEGNGSFFVFAQGTVGSSAGTSFSSPIWAGICALINQARAASGQTEVGLLAPKLYALAATAQKAQFLNDVLPISVDPNNGMSVNGFYDGNGSYAAGPGYDLVTGLGSPNIAGLIAALTGATITANPVSQTINVGSTVTFIAAATPPSTTGSTGAISYQWELNGNNLSNGTDGNGTVIAGSQGPQLLLTNTGVGDAGNYTCVVTFTPSSGSGTPESLSTSAANLAITSGTAPGAVTSLSARAFVGTGDNILIGGFYITGSTSVTVLIQAIGPSLAQAPYNVPGTLQHPSLSLHQAQGGKDVVLYSNTAWGSNPILLAAAAAAYAEPVLKPGSADSELLLTLPPGGYTAEVTGADGGTGVALCAIYQLQ